MTLDFGAAIEQGEIDRDAAAAALAQLNADEAQRIADELQAAVQRSLNTVSAPVASAPQQAPCQAPTPPLGWIAWCESKCDPTNHNPTSSAAGKYQYLDTTWNGYAGYPTADVAPEGVQDQRASEDTASGNYSPWNSSRGCWGGKF